MSAANVLWRGAGGDAVARVPAMSTAPLSIPRAGGAYGALDTAIKSLQTNPQLWSQPGRHYP